MSYSVVRRFFLVIALVMLSIGARLPAQERRHPGETLPRFADAKPKEDAKTIDSVEELAWLSCCGLHLDALFAYYDVDAFKEPDLEARLLAYAKANRGVEGYLPVMLLLSKGVAVDDALKAEILCARLGDYDLADGWSWIETDTTYCIDFFTAKELVMCGKPALKFLLPLLDRKAALSYGLGFGSESYAHVRNIRLRRCDLASRYVAQILGVPWSLFSYAERDEFIAELRRKAKKAIEAQ